MMLNNMFTMGVKNRRWGDQQYHTYHKIPEVPSAHPAAYGNGFYGGRPFQNGYYGHGRQVVPQPALGGARQYNVQHTEYTESEASSSSRGGKPYDAGMTRPGTRAFKLAELKTSVFDTYAVCAALLASFSCSAALLPLKEVRSDDLRVFWAIGAQQFMVRFCVIGAIHAMLVFMFSALYAKSALARPRLGVEVYERFNAETGTIRTTAFRTMYGTAIMFCVQVSLSTFYTFPPRKALCGTLICLFGVAFCVRHSRRVINAAGVVFMPDEKVEELIKLEADRKAEAEGKVESAAKAGLTVVSVEQPPQEDSEEPYMHFDEGSSQRNRPSSADDR